MKTFKFKAHCQLRFVNLNQIFDLFDFWLVSFCVFVELLLQKLVKVVGLHVFFDEVSFLGFQTNLGVYQKFQRPEVVRGVQVVDSLRQNFPQPADVIGKFHKNHPFHRFVDGFERFFVEKLFARFSVPDFHRQLRLGRTRGFFATIGDDQLVHRFLQNKL